MSAMMVRHDSTLSAVAAVGAAAPPRTMSSVAPVTVVSPSSPLHRVLPSPTLPSCAPSKSSPCVRQPACGARALASKLVYALLAGRLRDAFTIPAARPARPGALAGPVQAAAEAI